MRAVSSPSLRSFSRFFSRPPQPPKNIRQSVIQSRKSGILFAQGVEMRMEMTNSRHSIIGQCVERPTRLQFLLVLALTILGGGLAAERAAAQQTDFLCGAPLENQVVVPYKSPPTVITRTGLVLASGHQFSFVWPMRTSPSWAAVHSGGWVNNPDGTVSLNLISAFDTSQLVSGA